MDDYSYGNYYTEDPETLRRNFFIRGDVVNIRLRRHIGHLRRLQALLVAVIKQKPTELAPQLLQINERWTDGPLLADNAAFVRQYKKFIFEVVLPRIMIIKGRHESTNTELY